MSRPAVPHKPSSVEDHLKLEVSAAAVRHEHAGGVAHVLAGATKRHDRIILIATRLPVAAHGGACRVYASDAKLEPADDLSYSAPT